MPTDENSFTLFKSWGPISTHIVLVKVRMKVFGNSNGDHLEVKNEDIGAKNAYFWDIIFE